MNDEYSKKLKIATHEKLHKFDALRGREVKSGEFWDVVVVTAVDERQKDAYELQIREKRERKELPLGIDYRVFSDPPGFKIGNGGSTLYALQHLSDTYRRTLSSLKVLLIHAGGLSQRLPCASALGKIFTALPVGDPLYQMLELKLAMYVDFPSQMKPGVLVTCADDIELYSVANDQCISFDKPGFTALAHPSPLSIGTTHGVFVLESHETSTHLEMETTSCLHFLHKPNIDKMHDTGAVCKKHSNPHSEFVYTDSTYYFDYKTSQSLLNLLKEVGPLDCEIDAYGDFLQALGPEASIDYTSNTANVTKEEGSLVEIRKKIFNLLRGTPLNVILLNNSKFYHIGTTLEFLFHLTEDKALRNELGLLSSAFSKSENPNISTSSCVMYSVVDPSCSVGIGSVVEYSRLEKGVSVGSGSIVSSCWIAPGSSVPDGVFMHSLCVNENHHIGFVTVTFGINDDLKRSMKTPANIQELKLVGSPLPDCLSRWGMDNELLRFSGNMSCCSLWNACLFPVCSDLKTSFSMSLEMLQAVLEGTSMTLPKNNKLMSMQEALLTKNLKEMLKFRKGLYDEITQTKWGK